VDAGRENLHGVLLHASIVNADLRVRDTTAVPRLGVRLVLNLTVATRRTTPPGD
jgi:hypothetical protein